MKRIILMCCLLLAAGCSTMTVEVSIIDPKVAQEAIENQKERAATQAALTQSAGEAQQLIDGVKDAYTTFKGALDAEYQRKGQRFIERQRSAQGRGFTEIQTSLSTIITKSTLAEQVALRKVLARELYEFVSDEVGARLETARSDLPGGVSAETRSLAESALRAAASAKMQLIGNAGLAESIEAYAVVSKTDGWKTLYNRNYGRALFGDMNIAIRMEQIGSFSIKGVTFDPSEAVRIASKATTQALTFAAQINGVPLKTKAYGTSEDVTSGAAASGELEQLQAAQALADAKTADRRDAFLSLADVILRERTEAAGSDAAKRQAAIDAVKAAYAAHKARMNQ